MRWRVLHAEGTVLTKTTREIQARGTVTGSYRLDCERFLGVSGSGGQSPRPTVRAGPPLHLTKSRLWQERGGRGCGGVQ